MKVFKYRVLDLLCEEEPMEGANSHELALEVARSLMRYCQLYPHLKYYSVIHDRNDLEVHVDENGFDERGAGGTLDVVLDEILDSALRECGL